MGRTGQRSTAPTTPVRTCVGCRTRTSKSELLRVVLRRGDASSVVPDEDGRMAGRGAHLHPTLTCLEQAERRRAFGRALRVTGPLDLSEVLLYIDERTCVHGTARTPPR